MFCRLRTTGGRPPSLTPRSPLRAGPGQGTHGTLFRCNFVSSRKYNSEPFLLHFAILRDPHPRPRTRPGQAAPPQIFQKMGGRWAEDNVTIGFIFFVQNTIVQNKSVLLVSLAGAGSEARPKSERRPPTPAGPVPSTGQNTDLPAHSSTRSPFTTEERIRSGSNFRENLETKTRSECRYFKILDTTCFSSPGTKFD